MRARRLCGVVFVAAGACASCQADSSAAAPPQACSAPADAADAACVLHVDGVVTDLAGAPVPHAAVSMCSRVCYGAAADIDGRFSIAVGDFLRSTDYALHVSGRPEFADVYAKVPVPANGAIAFSAPLRVPQLPAAGPALPASAGPASQITSGDLTLDVPLGATFTLDVADVAMGARGRELRLARVPVDAMPDFARGVPKVAALYALAPPGATSSAPLGVHLANAAGLPASAAVEIYVLDDDYRPLPPTAGTARLAANAHVSADGRTIDTDLGEGISSLTWLLVRLSP
jgi:hypothetical protein